MYVCICICVFWYVLPADLYPAQAGEPRLAAFIKIVKVVKKRRQPLNMQELQYSGPNWPN